MESFLLFFVPLAIALVMPGFRTLATLAVVLAIAVAVAAYLLFSSNPRSGMDLLVFAFAGPVLLGLLIGVIPKAGILMLLVVKN